MADISKEIQAFRDARKGKEVRGSMISLAQKVNQEVETNTGGVASAIANTNNAAADARSAAGAALVATDITKTATANANAAAANAEATRQDINKRLAAGEFKGDKGEPGKDGEKGEVGASGLSISTSTPLFSVYVDSADNGALHVVYDDSTGDAPPVSYRESDGAIYWSYDDGM